jgi:hypothetical protein
LFIREQLYLKLDEIKARMARATPPGAPEA